MTKIELIKKLYNFEPSIETISKLEKWKDFFIEYNSHTNLMSKNDISDIFEKHVLDSLSIVLLNEFKNISSVLDVGTGGGFPSVIISIFYPDKKVYGIDSRNKKINFLNILKNELNLNNFEPICSRIEDIAPLNVDIITNRAVGKIDEVWNLSKKHLQRGGFFISYKSKTAEDEANCAIKKFRELKNPEFISYNLPNFENIVRKLVVFKV